MIAQIFKNINTYYVLVIVGLLIYIFLHKSVDNSAQITKDKLQYDSLTVTNQKKLDSISNYYEKRLDTLKLRIVDEDTKILQNNQLIKDLQDAYNKEVPIINSYDVDQLQLYFSNYNQQSDTTNSNKTPTNSH